MAKRLEDLPEPNKSRIESYLGIIAKQDGAVLPVKPESRIEEYLEYIAENGGGQTNPYEYLLSVGNIDESYLAEVSFTELDYGFAKEYYKENISGFGSCSSVFKDGKLIRVYDWKYSESCGFVVRTPANSTRHAVIGIVGQVAGLTKDFVKSGDYSEMYKIVPFALVDGWNDAGLSAEINVVPNDKGTTTGTLDGKESVNALMLIRYILDRYGSVDEVIAATENDISIFVPQVMRDMGYEVHFLISDKEKSMVLEFVNNQCKWKEHNKITNFFIDGVNFRSDGTVPIIGDSDIAEHGLTNASQGLERYNIIVDHIGTDKELVEALKYSKLYTLDSNKWYSEFCGVNGLTISSSILDFEPVMIEERQKYAERSRETGLTDQTVHAVIYDGEKMTIWTQEDYSHSYEFALPICAPQDTSEIIVADVENESPSGTATNQSQTNKELVEAIHNGEIKLSVQDIVEMYDYDSSGNEESAVGTWRFNETIDLQSLEEGYTEYRFEGLITTSKVVNFDTTFMSMSYDKESEEYYSFVLQMGHLSPRDERPAGFVDSTFEGIGWYDLISGGEISSPILEITGGRDISNADFIEFLNSNASALHPTDIAHYDTTTLHGEKIIGVLKDETHDGLMSYYKWDGVTFRYIGSIKNGVVDDVKVDGVSVVTDKIANIDLSRKQDKFEKTTVQLTAAGWNNNTQTVNVTGLTTEKLAIVSPTPSSLNDYANSGIVCMSQGNETLTFNCENTPTSAIDIEVVIL